jgi:hypothetical protein
MTTKTRMVGRCHKSWKAMLMFVVAEDYYKNDYPDELSDYASSGEPCNTLDINLSLILV